MLFYLALEFLRLFDFVVGFISDNGYDSEGIERAIRGFSSIEKSAVRDYCAMQLEKE